PVNVLIMSYNVHFGAPGAGFTVTGGNTYGVRIDQAAISNADFHPPGVSISVAGNADVGDGTGFSFVGVPFQDNFCHAPVGACLPAPVSFADNEATSNGVGFAVDINSQIRIGGGAVVLQSNVARGAGTGFTVHPGVQDETAVSGTVSA